MNQEEFLRFFDACDPTRPLTRNNPDDERYYVEFAKVRGGEIIVEALKRRISLQGQLNKPTCQLFTGHIGSGKSTELYKLQSDLEQANFHVVYFESTQDLDMADVDITDILLAITRQVSENLEKIGIDLKPPFFKQLFQDIADNLKTIEVKEAELSFPASLGKITFQTKQSPKLRSRLRQLLEPRTSDILQSLNKEVLEKAKEKLKEQGKAGLVVIVDNLDRVDNRPMASGRTQPEYLFIDRGEQLRQLNCHLVYTIPLVLVFSNESPALRDRFGGGIPPKRLPMVPVKLRDHNKNDEKGMALLKQMVMARAFPNLGTEEQLNSVTQVFESVQTLDLLCQMSGGHVRALLGILSRCLERENIPISQNCLEQVIQEYRDSLVLAIKDYEWTLLKLIEKEKTVGTQQGHASLLRNLFVFEYQDEKGRWFDINPVLKETEQFKSS